MITSNNYIDLADGKFKATTPADLDNLFAALQASPNSNHLVIHFHGGLVSRAAAEGAADKLLSIYERANAYPVFFFWRSDLWTTLTVNLDEIAREDLFRVLVQRLVRLAASAFAAAPGTRTATVPLKSFREVPSDLKELAAYAAGFNPPSPAQASVDPSFFLAARDELHNDPGLQAEVAAVAATTVPMATVRAATRGGGTVAGPKPTKLSPRVLAQLRREQSGMLEARSIFGLATIVTSAVEVLKNVIARFVKGRDHGLYTTIVEEVLRELYIDNLGGLAWEMMKKDTRDAFGTDPQCGGTAFLARLAQWWQPGRRITLIGHSTGAIYIGHFLEFMDRALPEAARASVAFLAPACTFPFLADRLPLFNARVDQIRVFDLHDGVEHGYWEVPVIYPASLLYLVSGLFEPDEVDMPLVGMERYYSCSGPYARADIAAVTAYLNGKNVWSVTQNGAPGWNSAAQKHGGMDLDPDTCASLQVFLQ